MKARYTFDDMIYYSDSMSNEPVEQAAVNIMDTLPVDSSRKISYATFSIADIESDGETRIVEFDNPRYLLVRDGAVEHGLIC